MIFPRISLIALAEYHKTNVDYLLGLTKTRPTIKICKAERTSLSVFLQPISYTFIQSSSMYDLLKLPMTFLEKSVIMYIRNKIKLYSRFNEEGALKC